MKLIPSFFTEEQVGFAVGYTAAFVVDKFGKITAMRYSYKTAAWIAKKTKLAQPLSGQVLFERAVDGVYNAF